MAVTTHMCRGNFRSSWAAEGGYDFVAEALFSELAVDGFFLEYDDERSGGFAPLRFVPRARWSCSAWSPPSAASWSRRTTSSGGSTRRRQYVPLEQLCLSPQCGFSSTVEGNVLTLRRGGGQAAADRRDRRRGLGLSPYSVALLDWLGCAARGAEEPAARAARGGGRPGGGGRGAAGHVLDFDDTYLPGLAHLSAPSAPAALVLGRRARRSVGEVLDAFAAGFEAMGALARAAPRALRAAAGTPPRCAAAWGRRWPARTCSGSTTSRAAAVALALLRAGGLRAAFGSDGKALQVGMAAGDGRGAARLAAAGPR